jgi:hypothetical protein
LLRPPKKSVFFDDLKVGFGFKVIHISSNNGSPNVGLYSWVTDMWGHMGPVPRVSDPTAEGSNAEDLIAKKKLSIGLNIEHQPM